ncbi:unnamed protein product [Strongylus vulgaris]|uniref:Uncharacterized protein n=1 Tax=Strongylus vulgaris TaxID=40348 RepID=A0A3P7IUR6_STRVU|nr:unnamed protein product [Strongylus vulgaris]
MTPPNLDCLVHSGETSKGRRTSSGWESGRRLARCRLRKTGADVSDGAGPPFALSEMRPLIALKLAGLVQLAHLVPQRDFHPLLDAPPHLPGVRLRVFPSGISYLSQVK